MKLIFILFFITLFIIIGIYIYFRRKGTQYNKIVDIDSNLLLKNEVLHISEKEMNTPTTVIIRPLHELLNGEIIEEDEEVKVSIAPNNSILDFIDIISNTFTLVEMTSKEEIPKTFTWKGKADISSIFNQYNCGCCWAIGTTQVLNDMFVTGSSPLLKTNPSLSPQELLSCYKSGQCKGGNPLDALKWIEKNGISVTKLDYEWCKEDSLCTKKYSKSNPSPEDLLLELNFKIPSCPSKKSNLKYYITDIKHPHIKKNDPNIEDKVSKLQLNIKNHIYLYGPVVGGITVYSSLLHGNFLKRGNKKAIYFDTYNYHREKYEKKPSRPIGFHTISVVGWGVDDEVDGKFIGHKEGTKHKVEYWIVRNSWGKKWGIDGYFHLAMYPYNKYCQLEVSVSTNGGYSGGFIYFKPSFTPTYPSIENYEEPKINTISIYQMVFILILFLLIIYKINSL